MLTRSDRRPYSKAHKCSTTTPSRRSATCSAISLRWQCSAVSSVHRRQTTPKPLVAFRKRSTTGLSLASERAALPARRNSSKTRTLVVGRNADAGVADARRASWAAAGSSGSVRAARWAMPGSSPPLGQQCPVGGHVALGRLDAPQVLAAVEPEGRHPRLLGGGRRHSSKLWCPPAASPIALPPRRGAENRNYLCRTTIFTGAEAVDAPWLSVATTLREYFPGASVAIYPP